MIVRRTVVSVSSGGPGPAGGGREGERTVLATQACNGGPMGDLALYRRQAGPRLKHPGRACGRISILRRLRNQITSDLLPQMHPRRPRHPRGIWRIWGRRWRWLVARARFLLPWALVQYFAGVAHIFARANGHAAAAGSSGPGSGAVHLQPAGWTRAIERVTVCLPAAIEYGRRPVIPGPRSRAPARRAVLKKGAGEGPAAVRAGRAADTCQRHHHERVVLAPTRGAVRTKTRRAAGDTTWTEAWLMKPVDGSPSLGPIIVQPPAHEGQLDERAGTRDHRPLGQGTCSAAPRRLSGLHRLLREHYALGFNEFTDERPGRPG